MPFPINGMNVENPFDMQPPQTTSDALNVRGYEPAKDRQRGGSRSGLVKYLPRLDTGRVIQHLNVIVDPQADALTADTDEDIDPNITYIDDPSTNNLRLRNPGAPSHPRRVRRGGSGRQSNVNVNRSPITITWANPADIIVGTALSSIQLNAVATSGVLVVMGTFVYTPSEGAVLPLGPHILSTVFTPTDQGIYRGGSAQVTINVVNNKTDTYIDPFSGVLNDSHTLTQQSFSAVGRAVGGGGLVPGVVIYDPLLSTTPSQPSITIAMTFTPSDTNAYNGSSLTQTYTVIGEMFGNGTGDCTEGRPTDPTELMAWLGSGRPASFTNVVLTVDGVDTPHADLTDILADPQSGSVNTGDEGITILVTYAEGDPNPHFTYIVGGA